MREPNHGTKELENCRTTDPGNPESKGTKGLENRGTRELQKYRRRELENKGTREPWNQ